MGKKTKKSKTVFRLLKYVFTTYKLQFFIVFVAIIVSAIASVIGIQFIQQLIDNYIVPLIGQQNPDFSSLLQAILGMAGIYLVGIIATYVYNRLMINISQGILNKIRTEMFEHMQTLPIGYFDSHSHGETMSTYTNEYSTSVLSSYYNDNSTYFNVYNKYIFDISSNCYGYYYDICCKIFRWK